MNIIVVENDSVTQDRLKVLLQGEPDIEQVKVYENAEIAIQTAPWESGNVLLLDIDLPTMSGIDLLGWVSRNHPHFISSVYTERDTSESVFAAIEAGAHGYLLKNSTPRELIESLQQLKDGGSPMSPRIARKVVTQLQKNNPKGSAEENPLTSREREILRLIADGSSYKEIAASLFISHHTVHTHIKKIYEKAQESSRTEVISKARRLGWI